MSIPIPKAIVATITSTSSERNLSWFSARVFASSPAWYGRALMPLMHSSCASSSTFLRLRQYIMPDLPGFWRMNLMMSFSVSTLSLTS